MPRLRITRPESAQLRERELRAPTIADLPVPAAQPAARAGAESSAREDRELIAAIQARLVAEPEPSGARRDPDYWPRRIAALVAEQIESSGRVVSERERARLTRQAQAEQLGLGPLDPLLADESVTEIMVNGPHTIWVERGGKIERAPASFINDEHVRRIIDRIISPLGRRCDESTPMVDARLPDGSRLNATIPPLCLNGPSLTIRKFFKRPLGPADLIARGAATPELIEFLKACVQGHLNVIVSGGSGP
jgi:pilus assembly protein CpaF